MHIIIPTTREKDGMIIPGDIDGDVDRGFISYRGRTANLDGSPVGPEKHVLFSDSRIVHRDATLDAAREWVKGCELYLQRISKRQKLYFAVEALPLDRRYKSFLLKGALELKSEGVDEVLADLKIAFPGMTELMETP